MVRFGLALLLLISGMAAAMGQAAPQPAAKAARAKPSTSQSVSPPPAASGKCVGVLSQLGETFAVEKVGIVVFQNALDEVPIDSWRIDDLVAARISTFVGHRATVRRLTLPRGAIAS